MFVDRFFHRRGAGKGGFLAHRGGGRAQRKTGHAPQGLQRGGPHAALIHQPVEGLQVPLFLLGHVLDGLDTGRRTLAPFQHRKLAFINPHRAIFAGMIHPDHRFDVGRGARRGRLCCLAVYAACLRLNRNAPVPAIRNEKIALYPASDRPNRLQVTTLQLTCGARAPEPIT